MLVFEDNVVLNEHYNIVHGQKRTTRVVFGFGVDDEEEESKVIVNQAGRTGFNRFEEEDYD